MKGYQATFDHIWKAISEQAAPSMDGQEGQYRSSTGLKCPIGHLIPDDLYDESIEGETPEDFWDSKGPLWEALSQWVADPEFLMEIQDAHDDSAWEEDFLASFQSRMRLLAHHCHLEVPA